MVSFLGWLVLRWKVILGGRLALRLRARLTPRSRGYLRARASPWPRMSPRARLRRWPMVSFLGWLVPRWKVILGGRMALRSWVAPQTRLSTQV